ncbi:hypothetical protein [Sphingomonas melonis]|uniref:hypothetical protein n=1 Tax=Sphingomonas melonis TaxID=152682 RepID=UPI00211B964A|nr:hypothetical protein [Sphingomonas melonis]
MIKIVWMRQGTAFSRGLGNFTPCVRRLCRSAGNSELAGAVDTDEQVELDFGGLHLGNLHMEEAKGKAFEEPTLRLVTFDVGRAGRHAAAGMVQRCPYQVRDRWLQGVEAVVERQRRVSSERHNHPLLRLSQGR